METVLGKSKHQNARKRKKVGRQMNEINNKQKKKD